MSTIYGVTVPEDVYKKYKLVKEKQRIIRRKLTTDIKKCSQYTDVIKRKQCIDHVKRKYFSKLIDQLRTEAIVLRNVLVDAGLSSRKLIRLRLRKIATLISLLGV